MLKSRKKSYFLLTMVCIIALAAMAVSGVLSDAEKIKMAKVNADNAINPAAKAPADDQQQQQKSAELGVVGSITVAPQTDPAVDEAIAAKIELEQEILRRLEMESAEQGADKGGPIDRSMFSDVDLNPKPQYDGPENIPQHMENGEKQGGDDIANATAIGGLPYNDAGTTSGYADDYDEQCSATSTSPDVVYSFAATVDTFLYITLCNGSTYDTKLFVYEDNENNLVDCNDDICPNWVSELECVPVTAGHTYYIVIDGWGGDFGDYIIDVTYCDGPPGPCVWECGEGVAESEACGEDLNGGCNMATPAFEPIDCGVTVCGIGWADGGTRDTDWYSMTVVGAQMITVTASANFPWVAGFLDTADCIWIGGIDPAVIGNPCDTGSVSRPAQDQEIWLFVGHLAFEGNPCGSENEYSITVTCEPISTGACCYADGSCVPDMDEGPCLSGGGTWLAGVACTPNPCPQPAPEGADCSDPIKIDIPTLPYVDNNTTCGMVDDYNNTCLGSYDGGEDILYEVTVAGSAVNVDITMTSDASWTGLVIDASCPPDPATCIATATGSSADKEILGLTLDPGVYYIMIDTWPSPACINSLTLTITDAGEPPPPTENDNCADATEIGEVTDLPFNTDDATADEAGGCMTSANIWYNYTASFTGNVIVDLCGSSYDTKLAAYSGSCGALTSIDCNDDSPCTGARALQSTITFAVTSGSSYLIEVGGYSSNTGAGDLTIAGAPDTPENDNCADVTPLPLPQVNNGNNEGATHECGFFGSPPGHVWEAFVLETCADVTLTYCGSAGVWGNAWLNLAIGCPCTDYTDGAAFDFGCPDGNVQMTWSQLLPGTYYYPVMLDPGNGAVGDYTITITGVEVPCPEPCTVECPSGGIPEGEACSGDETDDTVNGGCNSVPPVFGAIECNTAVCGTGSTFLFGGLSYRDTDWYAFTLTDFNQVTWTVESEIAEFLIFMVAAGSCDPVGYEILGSTTSTEECTPISLTFDLGPGDYWVLAMPSVFTGYPCSGGANDYVGTLTCTPIEPAYCDASGGCDEYIQRIEVGSIDNTSGCEGYGDFTSLSTPMEPGGSYSVTLTIGSAWSSDAGSMWIDYDQNMVFDLDEETFLGNGVGPYNATINVPGDALPGPTTMRFRMCYACTPAPCGAASYGEVEDYTVNIGVLAGNLIVTPPSIDFGTVAPGATGDETLTLTVDDGSTDIDFATEIIYGGKSGGNVGLYTTFSNIIPAKAPYTGPANIPQVDKQGGEDIGSATSVGSLPYSDAGTTAGYTDDYDEECPYTGSTSPDVVYAYTPAADETVNITLCAGSAYDTKLYIYENSHTPGAPFACNDDECPGYVSELMGLALTGGNTYYIVIDGYGGDAGSYTIDIDVDVPPDPFDCPDGAIAEAEACGDDLNGGCNMIPTPAFEAYTCGDTVCGTAWADGNRDTDWYQIEMFVEGPITMTASANFPFLMGLVDTSDCAIAANVDPAGFGEPGDVVTVTRAVAGVGIHGLLMANQGFSGSPCGTTNDYWFTADCDPGSAPIFWLSVAPETGTVPGAGSLPVVASYDAAGLEFGTYTADIVFIRTGKANVVVPVTLTVGETHATLLMDPDPVFAFMQYAVGDLSGHVYIGGEFDPPHTPDQITGVTLTANSVITINSATVIPFQDDIGGPALDIDFDLVELAGDFGVLYDLSTQAFNVTGTYASGGFSLDGELGYFGHVSGDLNASGSVDVGDLTFFVEFLFAGGPPPHLMVTADVDASGSVDVSDLTHLVEYLFLGGAAPTFPEI